MTRARNTADTQTASGGPVSPGIAGKNAIINGGMDIWQRGTSVSVAASTTAYTADRLSVQTQANEASTVSRQATGDTTNLPNIQYCARIQRNSGQTGTGTIYVGYNAETTDSIRFAGKTVTFSFYARAGANYSATSNALAVYLISGTGTDQNVNSGGYTNAAYPASGTATLTTTWQRFTYSGTVSTSATQLGFQFQFTPTGTASTNDYFEITGVQLELGSSATPFSRAGGTIQGELAACQRYYYRQQGQSTAVQLGNAMVRAAGTIYALWHFPVPLRTASATLTATNITSSAAFKASMAANDYTADTLGSFGQGSETRWMLTIPGTSMTAGWAGWLGIDTGKTTSYIEVSAEL